MFFLLCSYFYSTGYVQSENYPSKYPINIVKDYKIQVKAGLTLSLTFDAFDIEYYDYYDGGNCYYDHLTIKDGDGTLLLAKSCGGPSASPNPTFAIGGEEQDSLPALTDSSVNPPIAGIPITSNTNVVNLHFVTDYSVRRSGWKITFQAIGECQQYAWKVPWPR